MHLLAASMSLEAASATLAAMVGRLVEHKGLAVVEEYLVKH
jgi:hypothetical protein